MKKRILALFLGLVVLLAAGSPAMAEADKIMFALGSVHALDGGVVWFWQDGKICFANVESTEAQQAFALEEPFAMAVCESYIAAVTRESEGREITVFLDDGSVFAQIAVPASVEICQLAASMDGLFALSADGTLYRSDLFGLTELTEVPVERAQEKKIASISMYDGFLYCTFEDETVAALQITGNGVSCINKQVDISGTQAVFGCGMMHGEMCMLAMRDGRLESISMEKGTCCALEMDIPRGTQDVFEERGQETELTSR